MRSIAAFALFFLVAGPLPGRALAQAVHVAFLGDAGTGDSEQLKVRDQLLKSGPSKVFLLGDNIYSSGSRRHFKTRFDDVYAPLFARGIGFHAALGNHDVEGCDSTTRTPLPADYGAYAADFSACNARYHLEHASFGYVQNRRYYSVPLPATTPVVEVFILDSNTLKGSQGKLLLREDSAQIEWLESALARSRARWKIVVMHHPPHSPTTGAKYFFFVPVGEGRAREYQLEKQLAPIFKKHGVDVVMTGHNHFYARMVPQDGIRYFVSGGGGRKVYPFKEEPGYVAAGGPFYHFLSVRITPTAFEYRAIDTAGVVRDSGWFAKGDVADRPLPAGAANPAAAAAR